MTERNLNFFPCLVLQNPPPQDLTRRIFPAMSKTSKVYKQSAVPNKYQVPSRFDLGGPKIVTKRAATASHVFLKHLDAMVNARTKSGKISAKASIKTGYTRADLIHLYRQLGGALPHRDLTNTKMYEYISNYSRNTLRDFTAAHGESELKRLVDAGKRYKETILLTEATNTIILGKQSEDEVRSDPRYASILDLIPTKHGFYQSKAAFVDDKSRPMAIEFNAGTGYFPILRSNIQPIDPDANHGSIAMIKNSSLISDAVAKVRSLVKIYDQLKVAFIVEWVGTDQNGDKRSNFFQTEQLQVHAKSSKSTYYKLFALAASNFLIADDTYGMIPHMVTKFIIMVSQPGGNYRIGKGLQRYKDLPAWVKNRPGYYCVDNTDEDCFYWTIAARILYGLDSPVPKQVKIDNDLIQARNCLKALKDGSGKFDSLDAEQFEKDHGIALVIYEYVPSTNKKSRSVDLRLIYHTPSGAGTAHYILFLYDEHYYGIHNINAFVGVSKTKKLCTRCLDSYPIKKYEDHIDVCRSWQLGTNCIRMPKRMHRCGVNCGAYFNTPAELVEHYKTCARLKEKMSFENVRMADENNCTIKFKHFQAKQRTPVIMYLDTESCCFTPEEWLQFIKDPNNHDCGVDLSAPFIQSKGSIKIETRQIMCAYAIIVKSRSEYIKDEYHSYIGLDASRQLVLTLMDIEHRLINDKFEVDYTPKAKVKEYGAKPGTPNADTICEVCGEGLNHFDPFESHYEPRLKKFTGYAHIDCHKCGICGDTLPYKTGVKYKKDDQGIRFLQHINCATYGVTNLINQRAVREYNPMSNQEMNQAKRTAIFCKICDGELPDKNKFRKHWYNRFTGAYEGIVHQKCLRAVDKPIKHIQCVVQNISYDVSHVLRALAMFDQDILDRVKFKSVGQSSQKFSTVQINGIKFTDQCNFMKGSQAELVDNLARPLKAEGNGFFSKAFGEYFPTTLKCFGKANNHMIQKCPMPFSMFKFDLFNQTKLPSKKFFKCKEDYEFAKEMWKVFGCNTFGDMIEQYCMLDCSQLADIHEATRNKLYEITGLDPGWFIGVANMSLPAMLKMTGAEVELMTDLDMYLLVEKNIRGGYSSVVERHALANNPHNPGYDPTKPHTWLISADATSLYPFIVATKLPIGDYTWVTEAEILKEGQTITDFIKQYDPNGDYGYMLEVDTYLPDHLHDKMRTFPMFPEVKLSLDDKVSDLVKGKFDYRKHENNEKLICDLHPKKNYLSDIRVLQFALELGYVITKVHKIIRSKQADVFREFCVTLAEIRKVQTTTHDKSIIKSLMNSAWGRLMLNLRKYTNDKFVASAKAFQKTIMHPAYQGCDIISASLAWCRVGLLGVDGGNPIHLGYTILELSKLHMYKTYYKLRAMYSDPDNNESKLTLLATDTDSLILKVQTEDIFEDMATKSGVFDNFDFKSLPPGYEHTGDHNDGVLGSFKIETHSSSFKPTMICHISPYEFLGVTAKVYSIKFWDGISGFNYKTTMKGIKGDCAPNHEAFRETIFNGTEFKVKQSTIISKLHVKYGATIRKTALSNRNDKWFFINETQSIPFGYHGLGATDPNTRGNLIRRAVENGYDFDDYYVRYANIEDLKIYADPNPWSYFQTTKFAEDGNVEYEVRQTKDIRKAYKIKRVPTYEDPIHIDIPAAAYLKIASHLNLELDELSQTALDYLMLFASNDLGCYARQSWTEPLRNYDNYVKYINHPQTHKATYKIWWEPENNKYNIDISEDTTAVYVVNNLASMLKPVHTETERVKQLKKLRWNTNDLFQLNNSSAAATSASAIF